MAEAQPAPGGVGESSLLGWTGFLGPPPHAHHLLQDIVGEEAVLDVGHLHVHGDAVVVGPLLEDGGARRGGHSTALGPPPSQITPP